MRPLAISNHKKFIVKQGRWQDILVIFDYVLSTSKARTTLWFIFGIERLSLYHSQL